MRYKSDLTAQERAGIITYHLCQGASLDLGDICRLAELGERGARKMMMKLIRVLPIAYEGKAWMMLSSAS